MRPSDLHRLQIQIRELVGLHYHPTAAGDPMDPRLPDLEARPHPGLGSGPLCRRPGSWPPARSPEITEDRLRWLPCLLI